MQADGWKALVKKFAEATGFVVNSISPLEGAPTLPTTAMLWRSQYAQILVIPLNVVSDAELREYAKVGQEWLDVSCMVQESVDHKVMDGYLLLLSETPISPELRHTVRDIELDPTACRKHVAWPLAGESNEIVWRRLLRVTALGLPSSPQASGMTNTPTLHSDLEIQLLNDVKQLKGRAAARRHSEPPEDVVEP